MPKRLTKAERGALQHTATFLGPDTKIDDVDRESIALIARWILDWDTEIKETSAQFEADVERFEAKAKAEREASHD